jgi:hypothetical protein
LWELGHCLFASVSIDEELSIVHKVLEKWVLYWMIIPQIRCSNRDSMSVCYNCQFYIMAEGSLLAAVMGSLYMQ